MVTKDDAIEQVYSDCETLEALRELRQEYEYFQQKISPVFLAQIRKIEVKLYFDVSSLRSIVGLWEVNKTIKYHNSNTICKQKSTFEEFTTLLTKIVCMGRRPIYRATQDPEKRQVYSDTLLLTSNPNQLPYDYDLLTLIFGPWTHLYQSCQSNDYILQWNWSCSIESLIKLQIGTQRQKSKGSLQESAAVLFEDFNFPQVKLSTAFYPDTQCGDMKRSVEKLVLERNSQDQMQENTPLKNSHRKNEKKVFTFLTILITLFALIYGSHGHIRDIEYETPNVQFTKLGQDQPIFYDRRGRLKLVQDKWTLLMYYNLTRIWEGLQYIEDYYNSVTNMCTVEKLKCDRKSLNQLNFEMKKLGYSNLRLLFLYKYLSKGKKVLFDDQKILTNNLHNIINQHVVDRYQKYTNFIQEKDKYASELLRNKTSIFELKNGVLKNNEEIFKLQLAKYFSTKTDLKALQIKIRTPKYFQTILKSMSSLISELNRIQNVLIDMLTPVYTGNINDKLLTTLNLAQKLIEIADKIPRNLSLPHLNITEDIKDIYKQLEVEARVTSKFIILEVRIPLVSKECFQIYRAIALPIRTSNGTKIAQLSSQYIAINKHRSKYISLTKNVMKLCDNTSMNNLFCKKNVPIYSMLDGNMSCEAKLLAHPKISVCGETKSPCKNKWIPLHIKNTWLIACCDVCPIQSECNNQFGSLLVTTGIVTSRQGCLVQPVDKSITMYNQYYST